MRDEPGFRWLGLGDGVDRHLLSATERNTRVVGRAAGEFMSTRYDTWDRPDFAKHVDVIVELIVALVDRAFDGNDDGDPFFIGEATAARGRVPRRVPDDGAARPARSPPRLLRRARPTRPA